MPLNFAFVLNFELFNELSDDRSRKLNKLKIEPAESSAEEAEYYHLNCYSNLRLHKRFLGKILFLSTFTLHSR